MINSETIIKLSSYFTIIAHSPGRLRVRVNPKIVNEGDNISLDDITNLSKKISGIEEIKINKIIASVTITYNPTIFKPKLWEDLIKNENIDTLLETFFEDYFYVDLQKKKYLKANTKRWNMCYWIIQLMIIYIF